MIRWNRNEIVTDWPCVHTIYQHRIRDAITVTKLNRNYFWGGTINPRNLHCILTLNCTLTSLGLLSSAIKWAFCELYSAYVKTHEPHITQCTVCAHRKFWMWMWTWMWILNVNMNVNSECEFQMWIRNVNVNVNSDFRMWIPNCEFRIVNSECEFWGNFDVVMTYIIYPWVLLQIIWRGISIALSLPL